MTIWFTAEDPETIHLGTLRLGRDWPKNVAADPRVQLVIGDLHLEGEAHRIGEPQERTRIEAMLAGKYWVARIAGWLGFKPEGVFAVRVTGEAGG